jgi:hypothetical protein
VLDKASIARGFLDRADDFAGILAGANGGFVGGFTGGNKRCHDVMMCVFLSWVGWTENFGTPAGRGVPGLGVLFSGKPIAGVFTPRYFIPA